MIQSLNSLHSLTIDYNGFTPMGILAIINCLSLLSCFHRPFIKLSLCGNSMNTECAKALGAFLTHSNGLCLTSLHIDHMNIGTQGEQQIAASIASNQHCKLETLTGILLGPLMTELGSPPQLANFNNIQVLKYVKDMWSTYNQNTHKNCNGDNKRNAHHIDDYPDTDEDQGLNSPDENCHDGQQHNHQQQQYQQQSIGRKRAASIGTDENNTLSYSTNTQSEDDLTDLADDVQSHIRSSNPPASNNTNTITKPDNNALAETADETVIDTEQIRALMMKLEQIFDVSENHIISLPPSYTHCCSVAYLNRSCRSTI